VVPARVALDVHAIGPGVLDLHRGGQPRCIVSISDIMSKTTSAAAGIRRLSSYSMAA
jgi:hypothetical protein